MAHVYECPIWGTTAVLQSFERAAGNTGGFVTGWNVESIRADGAYAFEAAARHVVQRPDFDDEARACLTTWLVDERRHGIERPRITSEVAGDARRRRPLSVHERADRLLIFMRKQTQSIGKQSCFARQTLVTKANGQSWEVDETFSRMKAWSESVETGDVFYLFEFLAQRNFINLISSAPGQNTQGPHSGKGDYSEYKITPDGHARLAELETKTIDSKQAFVAMWFDDSMNEAFADGVAQGIRDAGYEPIRIDRKDHNNKIDDEIIAEIRRSRFLVADFTQGESGPRGGVYYEAGFAHALNVPVIFTCRKDAIGNVHFDTRQYNHIVWESPAELRERLAQRISATIGDGPLNTHR